MSAEQWHVVVPLSPGAEEWVDALAASVREVDPAAADAALRDVLHVPLPRKPLDPQAACERCKGTGGIPIGPGLVAWETEYDECPTCCGTGQVGNK